MSGKRLLLLLFGTANGACNMKTSLQNYTSNTTTCQGYLAYDETKCTASSKCPAVVVIQDWNGMNDYEKERARMLANLGYVGFAADIYGFGTPAESMTDWMAASGMHRGNPDLYMAKINAALDKVKSYDFVDMSKVAVIGYCFGGTGIVNMAILGSDVLGVVGYHSGIQNTSRVMRSSSSGPIKTKILLHSGVRDDKATDVAVLEEEFEAANATYEIQRFGLGVMHGFTDFLGRAYDKRADVRSWASTERFLKELFLGMPDVVRGPESASLNASLQNYTSNTTTCQGYLAYNHTKCTASSKCPAVVVIQDWNGMNDYEKERARMLANLGYVGFAADIYGFGTPAESMTDWMAASGMHRGNPDLYMAKINAALDKVKSYDFVDMSKVAVIGYCFGGTGIVNMAILGSDVLGVVGYHSGIQNTSRVMRSNSSGPIKTKILLHSGVRDDTATDVAVLEEEFEAANATYEIQRFGPKVMHGFTEWSGRSYDKRADVRSWGSTEFFLHELFLGMPDAVRAPEDSNCSGVAAATTMAPGSVTVTKVKGTMALDVPSCKAFTEREGAVGAVAAGIANATGVDVKSVEVTLTCSRRLTSEGVFARRLEEVNGAYEITVPEGSATITADSVSSAITTAGSDGLTTKIAAAMTAVGITDIVVKVNSISTPTASTFVATTTTVSTTNAAASATTAGGTKAAVAISFADRPRTVMSAMAAIAGVWAIAK
ncbi:unnamed protein product [Polarella glacialis]|uniref:Dienelactone hydrolase domain-containing protein n=1 Tax=Polarella glacialis TaxID=89957 RepID=A0A813EN74_POLGL|nr:unnamed protein product [Polarella glacialis]